MDNVKKNVKFRKIDNTTYFCDKFYNKLNRKLNLWILIIGE